MAAAEATFPAMGGYAQVQVLGGAREGLRRARDLLAHLEARWSRFRDDSDVTRLNRAGGRPVLVSPETLQLVERAVSAWYATAGAFDPTILPALMAAGYDVSHERLVERNEVPAGPATPAPGCAGIEVDKVVGTVRLPEGIAFDPGGIGKGLAADLVAQDLLAAGAAGTMVNLGGDLRVAGDPGEGRPWRVIVEDPDDAACEVANLALARGAVATTSRRSRVWRRGAERLHHVIDPGAGRPARGEAVASTVIAGEAWWAEVVAKAAFLAGPDRGPDLMPDMGATGFVIDARGARHDAAGLGVFLA